MKSKTSYKFTVEVVYEGEADKPTPEALRSWIASCFDGRQPPLKAQYLWLKDGEEGLPEDIVIETVPPSNTDSGKRSVVRLNEIKARVTVLPD